MATESYVHGLGVCKTCGIPLLAVEGGNGKELVDCLACSNKKPSMKPGQTFKDPGETEMKRVLGMAGIHVPQGSIPKEDKKVTLNVPNLSKSVSLGGIIEALEALPMPKDLKQFKAINKAITILKRVASES